MTEGVHSPRLIRFGIFEVDLQSGELRKAGLKLKLTGQPFQVLAILLERPGDVVTREELQKRLWPDTFVDIDHNLNTAINKIREVLGDSADSPRFVETLPRRGYRFVSPITQPAPVQVTVTVRGEKNEEPSPNANKRKLRWLAMGIAGLSALLAVGFYWLTPPLRAPRVLGYRQLTKDRQSKGISCNLGSSVATDGPRVFFSEEHSPLLQASSSGGDAVKVSVPFACFGIFDISPDKTELLGVSQTVDIAADPPMWILSIASGLGHRLGNLNGHAGTWSPDGQRIIYATRGLTDSYDDLYMATKDGSEVRKLIRIEKGGVSFIRWSPDGKVVRMIIWQNYFGSVWEVSADGMNLHPVVLFPGENRIISSMSWTPDGRYFVFDSVKALNSRAWQIWARRETRSVFRGRTAKPVQLTTGAISFWNLALSPDSKHIFADGGQARGELARYDVRLSRLEPFLSGISADQVDFSRDGKWVTYATYPETILWRSRVDGRERMQLTTASHLAVLPRWSPDGTRIAFSGILPGEHSKLYVVSAEGGKPEMVSETQGDEMDPTWSPDGNSLIFGERYGSAQLRISSVDLRTGRISIIPGSEGMFSPRVSPDGRFIVASDSQGNHKQFLFDQETQKWSELMNIIKSTLSWQQWSSDSRSVYVSDLADLHAPVLYRVRIADHKVERVAAFEIPEGVTGNFLSWMGVAPDGSPLLLRDLSIEEIYALDFEAP